MPSEWEKATPLDARSLNDEHRESLVKGSGINDDVITGRGYYSLSKRAILQLVRKDILDTKILKADSWMGIPLFRPDGTRHGEIVRCFGKDLPAKYIWPSGERNAADVHPDNLPFIHDPSVPLIFTEGVKKADAIYSAAREEGYECVVVAINGCWGWRARIANGKNPKASVALPDFLDIALQERRSDIIVDSDYRTNDDVQAGWSGFAQYITSKAGPRNVRVVVVPPEGFDKQGADDYLLHSTLRDLLSLGTTVRQAISDEGETERRPLLVHSAFQSIHAAKERIPHLVEPILPERGITVLAGHSGTFKTWHSLALALDGAFGLPWLGHPELRIRRRYFRTLYVNKEMAGSMIGNRLMKMARSDKYRTNPDFDKVIRQRVFTTEEAAMDLRDANQRARLEDAIIQLKVELVVLDSLSMCWSGDENSSSEVGNLYSQLRLITEHVGEQTSRSVSWLILHHMTKPQGGGAKRESLMFNVRGSGQIIQQADTAMVMATHDEEETATFENRAVTIAVPKCRTDQEPSTFISKFSPNSGMFVSLAYGGKLSTHRAQTYATSHGDPLKFNAWVSSVLADMPAMAPDNQGLRATVLFQLIQQQWPLTDKTPPSQSSIRRRLTDMVAAGELDMLDENKRLGNLYRLPEPEEDDVPNP